MDKNKITGTVSTYLKDALKKLSTIDLFNCLAYVEKLIAERQEKILQKNKGAKTSTKNKPNLK